MLHPKSFTTFLCWIPLIKLTSLKNPSVHCRLLKDNRLTATVFPVGRVPLNTEAAPPWPNLFAGSKWSVAFSSKSYLKLKPATKAKSGAKPPLSLTVSELAHKRIEKYYRKNITTVALNEQTLPFLRDDILWQHIHAARTMSEIPTITDNTNATIVQTPGPSSENISS